MKQFKCALIGCGRICPKHLNAIKVNPKTELVAVCDQVREKAEKIGLENKVHYYTDYTEMIRKEKIDIVHVLTPNGTHAEIVIQLAGKVPAVIVEKPMAIRNEDAHKMISECKQKNTKLFVVKQNRFNKAIQKVRQALDEGKFGKIVLTTTRVRWTRKQDYYENSWHGTKNLDGGILFNQASHHIDLLQWLIGPVESVYCKKTTSLVEIETEDTATALLKFSNGALGIVEATTATRPKDLEGSISILGEKGTVIVGGFAVNKIEVWQFEDGSEKENEIKTSTFENPPDVYGFGHIQFLEKVIFDLEHNSKESIDGEEGKKSVELINAMYESEKLKKEVFLKR